MEITATNVKIKRYQGVAEPPSPIAAPPATPPSGWETDNSRLPSNRLAKRTADDLFFQPAVASQPWGWDGETIAARLTRKIRPEQAELPAFVTPLPVWNWQPEDRKAFAATRPAIRQEELLQSYAIPVLTPWGLHPEDARHYPWRLTARSADDLVFQPAASPAVPPFGWETERSAYRTAKRQFAVSPDLLFTIVSPAWGWQTEDQSVRRIGRMFRIDQQAEILSPLVLSTIAWGWETDERTRRTVRYVRPANDDPLQPSVQISWGWETERWIGKTRQRVSREEQAIPFGLPLGVAWGWQTEERRRIPATPARPMQADLVQSFAAPSLVPWGWEPTKSVVVWPTFKRGDTPQTETFPLTSLQFVTGIGNIWSESDGGLVWSEADGGLVWSET